MATLLCVWELGTDMGHLSTLRMPVELALAQGYDVVMALKEGHNVKRVFGDWPIRYLQAPTRRATGSELSSPIPSFAHLLIRQCFDNVDELGGLLRDWRHIFATVQPDVVLFEHSPTALIAAYGCGFKKILVGNGFTAPLRQQSANEPFLPFPTTTQSPGVTNGLLSDDAEVLKLINSARTQLQLSKLPSMHAIYGQADDCFLMTWPMLDPFGPRIGVAYLGIEPPQSYLPPQWPTGVGPLVFGYLHAFPSLLPFLRSLQSCGARAVLFVRHLPPHVRAEFEGTELRFVDQPVDLNIVASEADWVVNHGNHSTAAHFACNGVPQLFIPLHQEHLFLALNLLKRGAALVAYQDQKDFADAVQALSSDVRYRQNAVRVAQECDESHTQDARIYIEKSFRQLLSPSV